MLNGRKVPVADRGRVKLVSSKVVFVSRALLRDSDDAASMLLELRSITGCSRSRPDNIPSCWFNTASATKMHAAAGVNQFQW